MPSKTPVEAALEFKRAAEEAYSNYAAQVTKIAKEINRIWAEAQNQERDPASEPTIDGEEPCPDCGAPRKQGCGCWLNRPDHPWAKRRSRTMTFPSSYVG